VRFILGSDHAGVELRQLARTVVEQRGHAVIAEHGAASSGDRTDYPDVAAAVARAVAAARSAGESDVFGLLVCGTGQGMCIAANKVPGVRAGVASDPFSAAMLRAHNDAQVLCLGQRVIGLGLAELVIDAFCGATFEGGRHAARVAKLDALAE
jgi:ribose 5-phosphate isomerase B